MTKPEDEETSSKSSKVDVGSVSDIHDSEVSIAGRDVRKVEASTYIEHATYITKPDEAPEEIGEAPAPGEPPYKGLQYFDVEDTNIFFLRKAIYLK